MSVRVKKRMLNRSRKGNAAIFVLLSLMGIFMILPMVYSVSSALKPLNELWYFPPRFFVENPTLRNFKELDASNAAFDVQRYDKQGSGIFSIMVPLNANCEEAAV